MPVVTLVGDVLADVVEQRGVLEQLAVVVARVRAVRGSGRRARAPTPRPVGSAPPATSSGEPATAPAARRIARGSSDQSSGSCRPIASSTIPSRSAHSLTVSSGMSKSSIAVARNIEPATMRSTRRASRPSMRLRSDAVDDSSSLCSTRNSSLDTESWFSDAGTVSVRARGRHLGEVFERAAAPDRHLRFVAGDVDRDRREDVDEVLRAGAAGRPSRADRSARTRR